MSEYRFYVFYIPERMMCGIRNYIDNGYQPGSFLSSVITNNLREACNCADDENLENLPAYISYFYNEAPSVCWGSPELMKAWIAMPANVRRMHLKVTP